MAFDITQPLLERIREGLEHGRVQTIIDDLKELHPADIAEVLDQLGSKRPPRSTMRSMRSSPPRCCSNYPRTSARPSSRPSPGRRR
ncbi:MAG: hypothetical protein IPJ85_08765 [Flavobacteriales bacterium]|nr:hypothetical protein [Flavobacteriales bacterium]